MSATAFTKNTQSQIISINSGMGLDSEPGSEAHTPLPSLPQVSGELEKYFTAARQIEMALAKQKLVTKRFEEELRDTQLQYSKLASEADSRIREFGIREERLKSQMNTQLITYQQSEKILQNQVADFSRQVERDREERRKTELDIELMKANLDYMKQREESLNSMVKTLQENEKARVATITQLNQQLKEVSGELQRYRAAWGQVTETERKAKAVLHENPNLKSSIEELRGTLVAEKRRFDNLEELLKRERRDKRAALTCLHTTEAKLTQVSWELENMKKRYEQNIIESGFELKL